MVLTRKSGAGTSRHGALARQITRRFVKVYLAGEFFGQCPAPKLLYCLEIMSAAKTLVKWCFPAFIRRDSADTTASGLVKVWMV